MAKHPKAVKTEIELIESEAKDVMALHEKADGKIKGTGSAEINRRTALLLQQVYDLQAPMPIEVLTLAALRLGVPANPFVVNTVGRGVDPKYIKHWERAAFFEAKHEPDLTHQHPSVAALNAVANHVDVDRMAVRKWRNQDTYWQRVAHLRLFVVLARDGAKQGFKAKQKVLMKSRQDDPRQKLLKTIQALKTTANRITLMGCREDK